VAAGLFFNLGTARAGTGLRQRRFGCQSANKQRALDRRGSDLMDFSVV
jgi:hypothetical protein